MTPKNPILFVQPETIDAMAEPPTERRISMLEAQPASPVVGDIYLDKSTMEIRYYDGNMWIAVKAPDIDPMTGEIKEHVIKPAPDFLKDLKDA